MAQGKKVKFHGAFKSKAKAKARERSVKGYIEETTVRGQKRYVVISRRKQ